VGNSQYLSDKLHVPAFAYTHDATDTDVLALTKAKTFWENAKWNFWVKETRKPHKIKTIRQASWCWNGNNFPQNERKTIFLPRKFVKRSAER